MFKMGHRVKDCTTFKLCNRCGQNHHISLCNNPSEPVNSETEARPAANFISDSPGSLHVGTEGRVALQTACAAIRGKGQPRKSFFNAANHRSFVTVKVAQYARLSVIRRE